MNSLDSSTNNALIAVHRVIVGIRNLGYMKTESKQLADMLDEAEYLLSLMIQGGERFNSRFLPSLETICRQYPDFAYIAAEYKKGLTSEPETRQPVEIAA